MREFVELGVVYNGECDVFTPVIEVKSKKIMELYDKAYLINLLLDRLRRIDKILSFDGPSNKNYIEEQAANILKLDPIARFGQFRIIDITHTSSGLRCMIIHDSINIYRAGYYFPINTNCDKNEAVKKIIKQKANASIFHADCAKYLPSTHEFGFKKITSTDLYGKPLNAITCYRVFFSMHETFDWADIYELICNSSICGKAYVNAVTRVNKGYFNESYFPSYQEFNDEFCKIIAKLLYEGYYIPNYEKHSIYKYKRKKEK